MPNCKNCGKEIPKGLDFCGEDCIREYKDKNKDAEVMKKAYEQMDKEEPKTDQTIEQVLRYIGIEKDNFAKNIAYYHWTRFIEFTRNNSGKNWKTFIKPRLRSYVGIDHRYLEDYLDSCLSWGIMKLVDGNLFFIGVPDKVTLSNET